MKTRRTPRTTLATASILNGRHELSVHSLKRRDDSFTLHYTIAPPLPDAGDTTPVLLALEAMDDIGNEYFDWGGAYGAAEGGTYTNGSISARPALAPKACEIRVRLTFLRDGEEHPCHLMLRTQAVRP
ncbi:hypothetical protein HEK616_42670 [Streptomyces nigrescens]|uniref:Uncharacterized protein n=2 Tax=Streptomyces TaxID=1883 RepID=A0ABM7ZWP8_STRNI|nr:hypothetical protein [Streptomyces nigrescens]MEE4422185.1 hypothetical protein [Streptomyces sp. DSM 41528]BDM70780.1 hypothetical protein HEK616_42670 [Streptomyces nigrescens]